MAVVPKGKAIVNDTTPMICTIEGIAKKEHVVRSKLTFTVLSVRLCDVNRYKRLTLYVSRLVICHRIIL